jgi:phosphatidate cytidylyltransferase
MLLTLGGVWEWSGLMGITKPVPKLIYLVITLALFLMAMFVPVPLILMIAFVWWLVALLIVVLYPRGTSAWGSMIVRGIMGWLVLLPCWAAINFIRSQESGIGMLLFLFILIWGADSAAYFAGRKWGKTKLASSVSPGKSVEGVGGAVLFSLFFTLIVFALSQVPISQWPFILGLSVLTVLFSILGDLFESVMKRYVGVKDSGNLLPGHGGLLDRIDSLTAAAPIFALGSYLMAMLLS